MQSKQIQFEKDLSSTRWVMPNRDVPELAGIGWAVVGVGLVMSVFMIVWISGPIYFGVELIQQGQMFGWLAVAFALLGFGGLFFGIRMLVLGYKIVHNRSRSELEIRGKRLVSIEKLGWFDWRRKIRLDRIDELTVVRGNSSKENWGPIPDDCAVLLAKGKDKKFVALLGYSEDLTLAVANQLSEEIDKSLVPTKRESPRKTNAPITRGFGQTANDSVNQLASDEKYVPVKQISADDYRPDKPTNCSIVVHEESDGTVAYEVPSTGLVKGSKGLFLFSIAWLSFCTLFFGLFLFAEPGEIAEDLWIVILFALVFFGVGIGMLVAAINMGLRRAMIGVTPDLLFIETKSIFGTKWLEFDRNNILHVDVGDSNFEVNDEPVQELKIVQKDGEQKGLLNQLKEDQLEWLAYSLNSSLGIDPIRTDRIAWQDQVREIDPANLKYSEESRIELEETPGGFEIRVPSLYKAKGYLAMTIFGVIFSAIGIGMVVWLFPNFEAVFGSLFILMGFAFTLLSLYLGTRRFDIRVGSDRLEVDRVCLFGSRPFEWQREEIRSVELMSSGMSVNSEKLFQLCVNLKRGQSATSVPKTGLKLLTGWSIKEIAITAAILNRELDLETSQDEDEQRSAD